MQHGVPALWFLTGIHPDYHTTYDRADRINAAKMERVARLVHQLSWLVAQEGIERFSSRSSASAGEN
jgi:hypothetical protein